jgi:hypothetical protein
MLKIALIDDQEYWIAQIINSIPKWIKYDFVHFFSYKDALEQKFDIAFIDYFLDIDGVKWEDIIDLIDANIKIWFSSVEKCNKKFLEKNAAYSVNKLNSTSNPELEEIFMLILFDDLK